MGKTNVVPVHKKLNDKLGQLTEQSFFPLDNGNLWNNFTIGFDDFFAPIEELFQQQVRTTFPNYNIEKLDDKYVIQLGVAGYTEEDLTVETKDGNLYVRGYANISAEDKGETTRTMFHKGLASRKFERVFRLAEGAEVTNVTLAYGLLTIEVELPEIKEPDAVKYDINVV